MDVDRNVCNKNYCCVNKHISRTLKGRRLIVDDFLETQTFLPRQFHQEGDWKGVLFRPYGKRVSAWAGCSPQRSTSRRHKSFGEIMNKILQIAVGLLVAFLMYGTTTGNDFKTVNSQWIPTSTSNRSQIDALEGSTQSREIPSTLRSLAPPRSSNVRAEQILPLKESEIKNNREEIAKILEEGDNLTARRNWFDAKKYYEKYLRCYPDNKILQERFSEAKRRQEIEIRYQDKYFASLTSTSSVNDVLVVFDEVFVDVEKYHVDRPSYSTLFKLGIAGVAEALSEDSFYTQNNISLQSRKNALKTVEILRQKTEDVQFSTREEVRRVALWMARQLRKYASIPETATISEFLCSAVSSLDVYSSPLTPTQVEDVFSLIDGRFVGLGVELKTDMPTKIVRVIAGSPAEDAGVVAGEEIISIDGTPTAGLTGAEIGELLQGREGEEATLLVRSIDSKLRKVVAIRRPIDVPSVEDVHVLDTPGKIGYVRISCFQKTTANELLDAIAQLSKSRIKSLVIDLRQNPGGLLQEAINVSDIFLDSGTIVQTQGRNGFHSFQASRETVCSLPLVLLVDSNSASAAEIFAGAMQENERAIVVGMQSYGKGTVQAIVQLSGETASKKPIAGLRLTTEKFYSPQGRAYAGVGIIPNVVVPESHGNLGRYAQTLPAYAEQAEEKPDFGYIPTRATKKSSELEADAVLATAVHEVQKIEQSRLTSSPQIFVPNKGDERSVTDSLAL